jgi:hypothetical protein
VYITGVARKRNELFIAAVITHIAFSNKSCMVKNDRLSMLIGGTFAAGIAYSRRKKAVRIHFAVTNGAIVQNIIHIKISFTEKIPKRLLSLYTNGYGK